MKQTTNFIIINIKIIENNIFLYTLIINIERK